MKRLIKPVVIVVAVAVLGYLFVRSVRDTRSAPYTMQRTHLTGWTVAIDSAATPSAPVLSLRPPRDIAGGVFRQLFQRAAESMNGPSVPSIPLVLREEFEGAFAATTSVDALAEVARQTALDQGAYVPRCMGLRRESAPGLTRQLYFVFFDAPAFARFRQKIAESAAPGTFDAAALSPVLFVAASEATFNSWLPLRVNADSDCVAPIALE